MSFIKKSSENSTIYPNNYYTSRGSIGSLSNKSEVYNIDELEDIESSTRFDYEMIDEEFYDQILKFWGIYKRNKPKFNFKYFKPSER